MAAVDGAGTPSYRRPMGSGGRWVGASAVAVVAVWVLVSIGGAVNPGFKQYEQYLSALSADGTTTPGWGRAALLVAALGLLLVVPVLLRWCRITAGWVALAAAGVALIAAVPMICPAGTRFCRAAASAPPERATLHAVAVILFAASVVAAIATGAARVRGSNWAGRALIGGMSAVAVVAASPGLLVVSGLPQRWLLLAGQLAVVALAHLAVVERERVLRLLTTQEARTVSTTTAPSNST